MESGALRERKIKYGSTEPADAVLEGMEGFEPEMGDAGSQCIIEVFRFVEPSEKPIHFRIEPVSWRGFVMNAFAANGTGENRHWLCAAQHADRNQGQSGATGGKYRAVPGE